MAHKPRHGPSTHRVHGTGHITIYGYKTVQIDKVSKSEHVLIVERALGKKLRKGVKIHHVDGNKLNNAATNLVVCPNQAYHLLLHQRQRAYEICGEADWKKCEYCHQYDDPKNLYLNRWHTECRNLFRRTIYKNKK